MSNVGSAYVEIEARPKPGFEADAEKAITPGVSNVAKKAATAFAAAFVVTKAFDFAGDAFRAAEEANKVAAQTENVIKSTGAAAGVTADQVEKLAGAISRKTGVDDEAIQSASNLLLTFTGIKNGAGENEKIFDRTTQAAVDMAAALGTDAASAAAQLGKALNDPVAGAAKLARAGVVLTDAQKEQIKTFTEAGNVAAAQGIILDEVAKKFGGSAEAQATSTDKMRVAMGNAQEAIGNLLIPIIAKLTDALLVVLPYVEQVVNWFGEHKTAAAALAVTLGAVVTVVLAAAAATKIMGVVHTVTTAATKAAEVASKAWAGAQKVAAAAQWALNAAMSANPIALVVIAIAALVAGVVLAYQKFEPFRKVVDAVGRAITEGLGAAVSWLTDEALPAITGFASSVLDALSGVGESIMNGLLTGLTAGLDVIKFFYVDLPLKILGYVADAGRWLVEVGESILGGLLTGLTTALDVIKFFYIDLPLKVLGWIGDATLWLVDVGVDTMTGLLDGVHDGVVAVTTWFEDLGTAILGWVGDFLTLMAGKGLDLLTGLLNGIHDAEWMIINWALSFLGKLADWIGDSLGKGFDIGKNLVLGIVHGIESLAGRIRDAIMDALPSPSEVLDAITPSTGSFLDRLNPLRGLSDGDNSQTAVTRRTILAGTINGSTSTEGLAPGPATLGPNTPAPQTTVTIDNRTFIQAPVYGVEDLNRWAEERERKLAQRLTTGQWR